MSKAPALQFYPGDWMKDPHLSMCSPATRGIWVDLLCAMHENDRSGQITGTTDQIARLCRCTAVELDHAISELQTTKTADVTFRNGIVTVINRRMKREYETRQAVNNRVVKHRQRKCNAECNANVTSSRARSSSSSTSSSKKKDVTDVTSKKEIVGVIPAKKYRDRFTDEEKRLREEALDVLHYLNEKADRHLPDNYNGISVIVDRLKGNYSVESLKQVIDTKVHDPHFQKNPYLYTPETLFKAENIQRYLLNQSPEDFTGDTVKPAGGSKKKSDYPTDATF